LDLDPTTFEAIGSIPLVDPAKFWEGVGDAHILYGYGDAYILDASAMFHAVASFININFTSPRRKIVTTSCDYFRNLKHTQMRWRPVTALHQPA